LFEPAIYFQSSYLARVPVEDYIDAWRSHATLEKQAGEKFPKLIAGIEKLVQRKDSILEVGYTTRVWMARAK
jgi:hypothetical protein